jgi:hypothetical protein
MTRRIINASEVASLLGLNEKFQPSAQMAALVLNRSPDTKKAVTTVERTFNIEKHEYVFRGRANYLHTGFPVLVRERQKMLFRLFPSEDVQCQALCFIYNQTSCIFVERSKEDGMKPGAMDVKYDDTAWATYVRNIHEKLQEIGTKFKQTRPEPTPMTIPEFSQQPKVEEDDDMPMEENYPFVDPD